MASCRPATVRKSEVEPWSRYKLRDLTKAAVSMNLLRCASEERRWKHKRESAQRFHVIITCQVPGAEASSAFILCVPHRELFKWKNFWHPLQELLSSKSPLYVATSSEVRLTSAITMPKHQQLTAITKGGGVGQVKVKLMIGWID